MITFLIFLADKLQELLDKAEGPEALPGERKEMDELKALLPEIQEKVEDAMEGLKSASTVSDAVKDVLVSQECKCICKESLLHNTPQLYDTDSKADLYQA